MRMVLADDDGSDWSIEISDGACTKPLKQTPTATASKPNAVHPFFSREFKTKQSKTKERVPDAYRLAPVFTVGSSHSGQLTLPANDSKASNHRITEQATKSYTTLKEPIVEFICTDELGKQEGPGRVYTNSESEANNLVQTLKGTLGFDLEWRVVWSPNVPERRTALVQLCDHDTILVIQVSSMKRFPAKVLEVIESANITKLGANILNDGEKLYRDFGIRARGLVELGVLASKADANFRSMYNRDVVSLAKMVATYLGKALPKGKVRTSNWEANLTDNMIKYAANDCHCALMIHDKLQEIATGAGTVLDALACAGHVNPRTVKFKSPPAQRVNGSALPEYCTPEPPGQQQLRAYKLWHVDGMPLDQMCISLRWGNRVEPLKESTVISYVIGALQGDPRLPFNMDRLMALVRMEASSWQRHRQWIASRE